MKRTAFLLVLLLTVVYSQAQTPNWLWAESSNCTGSYEWGCGISVDTITNSLFAGGRCSSNNTLGGKTMTGTYADNPYSGRFDESGNAVWLSEYTYSTNYDYPAGYWRDKHDNTYSCGVTASGQTLFLDKWNSTGTLKWEQTPGFWFFGYEGDCNGIITDGAGCVYITGCYNGTLTLGSFTLSSISNEAIFIAKLDSNGNYLWAKSISGAANDWDIGSAITIDNNANIYITGNYTGSTTAFGSFTAPAVTSPSLYIAEYDSSGNALNLFTAPGALANASANQTSGNSAITIDSCGYLYVNGMFSTTAQFGSISLTSSGPQDIFTAKCTNSGTWLWATSINCGSSGGGSASIALDKYTNVYIGSEFSGGTATLGSTTVSGDLLVAKYDNGSGNLDWAQGAGSAGNSDDISGITVDNYGFAYVTGGYINTATFGSTTITNTQNQYTRQTIFIAKMDTPHRITVAPLFSATDSVLGNRLYCAGQTYPLIYTTTGTFNSGNTFTAELSDSSGSFNSPVTIGSINSTTNGTITITIPNSTVYGIHYLIRIISSNPTINNTPPPTSTCHVYPSADTTYFYCTIFPMPTPLITGIDSVCQRDSTTLTASGGTSYLWSNGDTTASITVSPAGTTQYTVNVSNGPCVLEDSVTVKVDSILLITHPADTMIILGKSVTLQSSGARSYTWSPDTLLSCDSCANPIASPTITTSYIVTGTSSLGCVATDTVLITVRLVPCDAKLVANAFTPGSKDNGNNIFYIQNLIALSALQEFRIYNRWGELIFETNDINAGWNGTFNGLPEPVGVYVWYIQGICRGQAILQTGNVTLLR